MLPLLLVLGAMAGGHEENTFALVAQGFEWATPDLRFEMGNGPVGTVLSWPITPVSISVLRTRNCRHHLLLEPVVEPQLRLGGDTRLLAGSQVLLTPTERGPGLIADGAAVRELGSWGWASGGGLVWTGGNRRGIRGRFALRGRYVAVDGASRGDVSLDIGLPITGRGWGRILRGEHVDAEPGSCPPDPVQEPTYTDGPDRWGEDRPYDPRYDPEGPSTCDPYGCSPGMCGAVDDGCGGTMFCGSCEEILPACDPIPVCGPGVCGEQPDGCGGTEWCGPCEEPPTCDPYNPCTPGVCGEQDNGCGQSVWCGECMEILPACDPINACALPGACGIQSDGCGGTMDCGPCDDGGTCVPIDCIPGTCGELPDGCGGTNDCGPCGP